eukprot:NODE_883_length_3330_cov_0.555246.p2 type:complete len:263 gc:universal NODE_883_length_3330_cov_0.555246:2543-1755(-)
MIFTTVFSAPLDNAYDPNSYVQSSDTDNLEKHDVTWTIENPPKPFSDITFAGDLLCGITKDDGCIYCENAKLEWDSKTGNLKHISLDSDGKRVVGVDREGNLVYAEDIDNPEWTKSDSGYESVEISNGHIVAINSNKELYTSEFGSSDWKKQQGYFNSVSIHKGKACGVSTMGHQVVCSDNITTDKPTWKSIDTKEFKFKDISVGDGQICGVSEHGVLICGDSNGENWYHTNGKMDKLVLNGGAVAVVLDDGRISHAPISLQ